METLVVYFSKFGNTQKLAETIAAGLKGLGTVRRLNSYELNKEALTQADVVVMGTPTHKMNLPRDVKPMLEALPRKALKGKLVAAFDTSYQMNPILNLFVASKRLDKKLRKLGGKRVVRPEIFVVGEREGPLVEGEFERARAWAQQIVKKVERARAECGRRSPPSGMADLPLSLTEDKGRIRG
jgi:flavodoxin